jgi:hypothetical protein
MQIDISGMYHRHQCDLAAAVNDVTLEELLLWNPGLGANINSTACSFTPGVRYCGRFYVDRPVASVAGPDFTFPLRVSWT